MQTRTENREQGTKTLWVYRIQLNSGAVAYFAQPRNARRYARIYRASIAFTGTVSTYLVGDVVLSDCLFDGQVE